MTAPRIARQLVASGCATAADAVVLAALCAVIGVAPGLAGIAASLVGGAVNFALGRGWVFAARDRAWWRQAARYAMVVVVGGAIATGVVIAVLTAWGAPLIVAKSAAVVVVLVGWTYPMSARVVFAPVRDLPARA